MTSKSDGNCSDCMEFITANWAHGVPARVQDGREAVSKIRRNLEDHRILNTEVDNDLTRLTIIINFFQKLECPVEKVIFSLSELAGAFLPDAEKYYKDIHFSLDIDPPAHESRVYANQLWLKYVMKGLVDNAAFALQTNFQQQKEIHFTMRNEGQYVQWIIQDNGPGMTKEQFDEKTSMKKSELTPEGRGLFLAKILLGFYEGTLVWSECPIGTRIIINLPISNN